MLIFGYMYNLVVIVIKLMKYEIYFYVKYLWLD